MVPGLPVLGSSLPINLIYQDRAYPAMPPDAMRVARLVVILIPPHPFTLVAAHSFASNSVECVRFLGVAGAAMKQLHSDLQ